MAVGFQKEMNQRKQVANQIGQGIFATSAAFMFSTEIILPYNYHDILWEVTEFSDARYSLCNWMGHDLTGRSQLKYNKIAI